MFGDASDAHIDSKVQWKIEYMATKKGVDGGRLSSPAKRSDIYLFGNTQRIFKFDTEVAHGAVHLGMTKQKLDCTKIAGFAVN